MPEIRVLILGWSKRDMVVVLLFSNLIDASANTRCKREVGYTKCVGILGEIVLVIMWKGSRAKSANWNTNSSAQIRLMGGKY